MTATDVAQRRAAGIGTSPSRPDGPLKVRGEFPFSSDVHVAGELWGQTVRSPHASARIVRVDTARALAHPGVVAVLTADDVPGRNRFGLVTDDQPVLAVDRVRFEGEAVAIVAAETPEAARLAAALVDVTYEPLPIVVDPASALDPDTLVLHEGGNLVRELVIRRGDPPPQDAPVVVRETYHVGQQDQAALGTESALAIPQSDGSLELHVSTQWLHADRNQLATVLDLPPRQLHLHLAGVGGAFGAKEDLSVQAHVALLALRTGRPVRMVLSRRESFLGHVHRHPATMHYEHGADADGRLLYVRAEILLDGGAYASTSVPVTSNAASFSVGPYRCPSVDVRARTVYTNNPPAGAMRGFGAVQVAFAHESQMDRIAEAVGISPLEVRRRNALRPGDRLPTGQPVGQDTPVLALLEALDDPLPDGPAPLPGGAANVTRGEGVRRGVGYAVGFKNCGMPEGVEDHATARVTLRVEGGRPVAEVRTAAAELGQGVVGIQAQIARTELGVDEVLVVPADTSIGSAGTSSASRQTYLTGGAVLGACRALRERVRAMALDEHGHRHPGLLDRAGGVTLRDGEVLTADGTTVTAIVDLLAAQVLVEEFVHRPAPTEPLAGPDGQGNAHLQFIYAAHRAVVDVDVETGLVSVVELTCAQDVGRALNPVAVRGQMEGGSTQGLGLALMEQLQVEQGRVRNASFTDYLLPTTLDVPTVRTHVLELADPDAPYGVKGAGEPSTLSSTPAIVAAVREACGRALTRVPISPDAVVGIDDRDTPLHEADRSAT